MANIKTITLGGAEQEVIISGQNCDIRNDGAEIVYASAKPNVTAGEDGVLAIPVGQAAKLLDTRGTVYLKGTGIVQICGSDYSDLVFKSAPAGGGSGTVDEQARGMASANAASISALRGDVEDVQTVAENISNPNLLDNPDFKINQRGKTEYTGTGYTVDRWVSTNSNSNITIHNTEEDGQYININVPEDSSSSTGHGYYRQYFELVPKAVYTMSADVRGSGLMFMNMCGDSGALLAENVSVTEEWVRYTAVLDTTQTEFEVNTAYFRINKGSNIDIRNVKLELGSVATPFTPPDPATELAKCQRYYTTVSQYTRVPCSRITPSEIDFVFFLPTTMRIAPSIDFSKLNVYTAGDVVVDGFTFNVPAYMSGILTIRATKENHGLASAYLSSWNNGVLAFSADL